MRECRYWLMRRNVIGRWDLSRKGRNYWIDAMIVSHGECGRSSLDLGQQQLPFPSFQHVNLPLPAFILHQQLRYQAFSKNARVSLTPLLALQQVDIPKA
jgi:hypothetical protein